MFCHRFASGGRRQTKPASRDHPDHVAAGKRQDVAVEFMHAGEEAVGPIGHVARRFAAGAAVAEQLPARSLLQDVGGRPALIAAVVPLHQIGIDDRAGPEAGQRTRLRGAHQGAGDNLDEGKAAQPLAELAGVLLAALVQRHVGPAGVPAGVSPGGVAVAGEIQFRQSR